MNTIFFIFVKKRAVMQKCFAPCLLVLTLLTAPGMSARAEGEEAFAAVSREEAGAAAGPEQTEDGALAEELESEELYEMKASLGFGLEYNDNIDNSANNQMTDFITHIRPSFSFKRLGGRIEADITYRGDYEFYLQSKDTEEYRHYINALVTGELAENLFFLSVHEDMSQIYRDVSRGEVMDDETLDDLVNRNRFTVSPFFTLRPSERTNLRLGYDFTDIRYSKGQDSGSPKPVSFSNDQYDFNYKKSQSHTVYLHMDHELSDRATFYSGATMTRWIDDNSENLTDQSFNRYTVYLGGAYAFSEDLMFSIKAGPSITEPDEQPSQTRPFVETDLSYVLGRSIFSAFYNTTYEDNPETGGSTRKDSYGVKWHKEFDRSHLTASISYSTFEDEIKTEGQSRNRANTYRPGISYTYDLSERLSCFMRYSATLYERHVEGDHRHYGSYGIKYELSPNDSIGLSHHIRYTDAYRDDSFYTNRVMLDFTHTF